MERPRLGVCYYPEHWPEASWPEDARRMADLGLTLVRIGEFAWSRLEPARGELRFDWLGRAIDVLAGAGLNVILGTPTATPPRWLVAEMPDMLPVDAAGRTREFGSRRHYSFSHEGYRTECARIVTLLADSFGTHPAVAAWQIDNEYGCHDTAVSYCRAAEVRFRRWLRARYDDDILALNDDWGNAFWSMAYGDFDEIGPPNLTVTEANPAHRLAFRRFASDEIVSFNRLQADILRARSPGRDIIHNFMGRILSFDHFAVGRDLDVSSWDSYPLGFLEDRSDMDEAWKATFASAGDPDFQAFHHDLYRATSGGRWWVMEQQPGPVNWAPFNPAPRAGMVRLWTHEAFAHGAEVVSYFRWRQAPFGQEQMHAGLLRPDSAAAPGFAEVAAVASELDALEGAFVPGSATPAAAAIVFDYPSAWAWEIQPQGRTFDYFRLVFDIYRALRRRGFSIDIVPANIDDLSPYPMILIPGLFAWNETLRRALATFEGPVLVGPRSGSKTDSFKIPPQLPPEIGFSLKVTHVESLRPGATVPVGNVGAFHSWREHLDVGPDFNVVLRTRDDAAPALVALDNIHYLAGWPDAALLDALVDRLVDRTNVEAIQLPDGVRLRRCGDLVFAFNYGERSVELSQWLAVAQPLLGEPWLPPSGVAVFPVRKMTDDHLR